MGRWVGGGKSQTTETDARNYYVATVMGVVWLGGWGSGVEWLRKPMPVTAMSPL